MRGADQQGFSRIVSSLKPGAGVVTSRCHVHYVATEYGIAYLYGNTYRAFRTVSNVHTLDCITSHFVVDSFANQVSGKNLDQRAKALIAIAHPEEREKLDRDRHALYLPGKQTTVATS